MLFGDGRIKCNIFFLKTEKLSEFLILLSRLFHSVIMDGKYEFLKKSMPNIKLRNIVNVFCSVSTSNSGDIIEKILGRFGFNWLEKIAKFPIQLSLL